MQSRELAKGATVSGFQTPLSGSVAGWLSLSQKLRQGRRKKKKKKKKKKRERGMNQPKERGGNYPHLPCSRTWKKPDTFNPCNVQLGFLIRLHSTPLPK